MKFVILASLSVLAAGFSAHAEGTQPVDRGIVNFTIQPGTGIQPWNTFDNPIVAKVGQTIRFMNNDSMSHFLHTNGSPCPHGSHSFKSGETYDCVVTSVHQASDEDLYDHDSGPDSQVYIETTN